jgi:hypothetical protein
MTTSNTPCVIAQMLIRRSVDLVFETFINAEETRNFWITKAAAGRSLANMSCANGKCTIIRPAYRSICDPIRYVSFTHARESQLSAGLLAIGNLC